MASGSPASRTGRGSSLRSTKLTRSIESLEKLKAPRPVPEWVMKRTGAKSSASIRSRASHASVPGKRSSASSASSTVLGHAPAVPVMEMGPSNVPIRFERPKRDFGVTKAPEPRDAVKPFPGQLRKPTLAKSASGVTIVYAPQGVDTSGGAAGRASSAALDETVASATAPPTVADREAELSLVLDLLGEDAETDPDVR